MNNLLLEQVLLVFAKADPHDSYLYSNFGPTVHASNLTIHPAGTSVGVKEKQAQLWPFYTCIERAIILDYKSKG